MCGRREEGAKMKNGEKSRLISGVREKGEEDDDVENNDEEE